MTRLQITLDEREATALMRLSTAELRDPRDQIRLIVRNVLIQRGLLEVERPAVPVGGQRREVICEPA